MKPAFTLLHICHVSLLGVESASTAHIMMVVILLALTTRDLAARLGIVAKQRKGKCRDMGIVVRCGFV